MTTNRVIPAVTVSLLLLATGCSFGPGELKSAAAPPPPPLPFSELALDALPTVVRKVDADLESGALAFDFQRIVIAPDMRGRTAELIVVNQFTRDITAVDLTLHYLDDAGQEFGTFPWSISAEPTWLDAGELRMITAGYRLPEAANRIEVTVDEIRFFDGTLHTP